MYPAALSLHRSFLLRRSAYSTTALNYFETLRMPRKFRQSPDALQSALHDAQRAWHPDRHAGGTASNQEIAARRSAEANAAYSVLISPDKRADHLLEVMGGQNISGTDGLEADEDLLMWVMETRERVDNAGIGELNDVRKECLDLKRECIARLEAAFDVKEDLVLARNETIRLRYIQRIINAIAARTPADV